MVLSLGFYGLDPQLLLKDNDQSSFLDVLEKSMKDDDYHAWRRIMDQ